MGYSTGSDRVHESDFSDVLKVLTGKSRWQSYIVPNLKVAQAAKHSFAVLKESDYTAKTKLGRSTPGVTFKKDGSIYMLEWGQEKTSFLGAILHECVHWVSDPAKQGVENSSAYDKLGVGLSEGLVECVTRDIMTDQGIKPSKPGQQGHVEREKVARALVDKIGVPMFGRGLFGGNYMYLLKCLEVLYSPVGLQMIRNLTSGNKSDLAFLEMAKWEKQEKERRDTADFIRTLTRGNQSLLDWILSLP